MILFTTAVQFEAQIAILNTHYRPRNDIFSEISLAIIGPRMAKKCTSAI